MDLPLERNTEKKARSYSESDVVRLDEKYKLIKKIGSGSFSTVYYATDNNNNSYAIKRIYLSKYTEQMYHRLLLELKISCKLNHPNIVKCFDVFRTQSHWYMVTEYCNYGTMSDLIKAIKHLEIHKREKYGCYYLWQLKNALNYLHENNIIHRDLKPMNILLSHNNANDNIIIKLADFGFSRYFESNPRVTNGYDPMVATICGSPIYMAPELIINGKYNTKADIWSFGVIMYELLHGVNPYHYPRNIPELANLMQSQEIKYSNFSQLCLDLLQQILQVDPVLRIEWNDFFNHEWFKGKNTNLQSNEFANKTTKDTEEMFAMDEDMEDDTNDIAKTLNKNFDNTNHNLHNSCGDDFVVVNNNDLSNEDLKVYKETYASSIIKILTSSITYLFGNNEPIKHTNNNQAYSI